MWIFTNRAFVSIVQVNGEPGLLLVRGRFKGDVARFLGMPAKAEQVTPERDYRFRIIADRDEVEAAILRAAQAIDYGNFKNSVPDNLHHDAYSGVWGVMWRAQQALYRVGGRK